ncbi:hypothetical protein BVF91_03010 [Thermoanaerobacterium sp. PSU-2]|uniref:DUF116 domain-containing protein n=1 Tax=Thermoanaerobacterium sp. PSU-2 TaxID=1930849 RepID=UPI000A15E3D6|nr:DUF116 domain-containing protein [Thermoanaerobacterium sp. PSU-2]MDE4541901.1 DUF116 domain-containing protein [Thermoanaerobacterium sp. R66]ORX24304.1 hypothetical protein BVF91_03010 [Thermoanaerobacterium sp. PSU-2]
MNGKKRVFFGLLSILILLMTLSIFFLFYIVRSKSSALYNFLIGSAILFFSAITIVLILTVFAFLYVIYRGRNNEILNKTLLLLIDGLYPLLEILGGIFGVKKDKIQQSFTNINNFLVSSRKGKYLPEELLILTPHCIQFNECKFKVTNDIDNCQRCGKCQVSDLIKLKEKYGVKIAIATGGTLARKAVMDTKPKAIIAIACERDLTSGILDVKKIPVYGIINIRPYGPCFNTKVDLDEVEKAIINFTNGG